MKRMETGLAEASGARSMLQVLSTFAGAGILCGLSYIFEPFFLFLFFAGVALFLLAVSELSHKTARVSLFALGISIWMALFVSVANIAVVVVSIHHGFGLMKYLVPVSLILYIFLSTFAFFYLAILLFGNLLWRGLYQFWLLLFVMVFINLAFIFVSDALFCPFGSSFAGLHYMDPLVPFIGHTSVTSQLLKMLGPFWTRLLLTLLPCLIALLLVTNLGESKNRNLVWLFVFLILLLDLLCTLTPQNVPAAEIAIPDAAKNGRVEFEQELIANILKSSDRARMESSRSRTILVPESAYPFPLNQEILDQLPVFQNLDLEVPVLFGTHRLGRHCLHNSVFILQEGRLSQKYDKMVPLPFTEFIPTIFQNSKAIQEIFLKDRIAFCPASPRAYQEGLGDWSGPMLEIDGEKSLIFVCSEFFLGPWPSAIEVEKEGVGRAVILANESWFSCSGYFRRLLALTSRLFSIVTDLPTTYVSHYYLFESDH